MTHTALVLSAAAIFLSAAPALADQQGAAPPHGTAAHASAASMGMPMIHVPMIGADGKTIGMAMLQDTPGGVLVSTDLKGLPAGQHGFHFHEKGLCDAKQKFTTAGAHFTAGNPQHGLLVTGSHHGGDMPNAYVGTDGVLKTELLNTGVTLTAGATSLADADGSALVIHAKPDDYKTQPSGDAGDRIACAVVAAPKR